MTSIARGTALVLLVASIVVIVAATTMPWSAYYVGHSHWAHVEWIPFSRTVRPVDFLLNILLFVPFGFSATASVGRDGSGKTDRSASGPYRVSGPCVVVGVACLLSLSVELFQVYCHGRLPTTTDVLSNATGAYLGSRVARRVTA